MKRRLAVVLAVAATAFAGAAVQYRRYGYRCTRYDANVKRYRVTTR